VGEGGNTKATAGRAGEGPARELSVAPAARFGLSCCQSCQRYRVNITGYLRLPSLCVCLRAYPRKYTSGRLQMFVHVTYGRGSVLWRRCDMLLGFVDYVILAYNEPRGGMSIPLQRVKSLHRRAQANAPQRRVCVVS